MRKLIGEIWTILAKDEQHFENKTAKMRKCLTKFSRIVEGGAVQRCVTRVDLVKSFFETDSYSNEYLVAKFGVGTAENEPLKVCQKFAKS